METMIDGIKQNAGMAIFTGILLIILGILAMGSPLMAGLSVALFVGWMLIAGGIMQIIFAIRTKGGIFAILMGVLSLLAGGYMISNPGVTLAVLSIILAAFLIVSGIAEAMVAFSVRPADGWVWALISAIASFILGVMIWQQFPIGGALAIGILLGLKLLFSGMMLLMLGTAVRKAI
jgi:uncharacterized membrane protein HdeD (DUF308 family)